MKKRPIIDFLKKRYIDVPAVNMWRVYIILPCLCGMFWLFGQCARLMAERNIYCPPEVWFILGIAFLGIGLEVGRFVSDRAQLQWEKWSKIYTAKLNQLSVPIDESEVKIKEVRFFGKQYKLYLHWRQWRFCVILLACMTWPILFGYKALVGWGCDPLIAFLVCLGGIGVVNELVRFLGKLINYRAYVKDKKSGTTT